MKITAASFRRQKGASALEFALVFPLFFFTLFAIVHYGVLFMLEQGITLAAEEGARSAVAVNPAVQNYSATVCNRVNTQVATALAWMPSPWFGQLTRGCVVNTASNPATVTVTLTYAGYSTSPPIPALGPISLPMLPSMTTLPPLPASIASQAIVQL